MGNQTTFGIYFHWPFCAAKCPYCDFNSHVSEGPIDEARFLLAYKQELQHWADQLGDQKRPLTSLFFGGGTPSLMSPYVVEAIIDTAVKLWGVSETLEISLEANPQSVDASNFKDLRLAGVNRLSIGVQAFDDSALKALGRLHDAAQARQAIEIARAHFSRFSFDLIYARPQQTLVGWEEELNKAFSFEPSHLSLYQLTIEPNTAYKRLYDNGHLILPTETLAADFYELTQCLCSESGLPAYEVSNHAQVGQEARHNLLYWHYGDFLGIGPGAHGRIELNAGKIGTVAAALPGHWLELVEAKGHGLKEWQEIDLETQAIEMLLMGLRLKQGFSLQTLEARTGYGVEQSMIDRLCHDGLLEALRSYGQSSLRNEQIVAPTAKGMALLNHVAGQMTDGLRPVS